MGEKSCLEFFACGVPPGEVFRAHVDGLLTLAEEQTRDMGRRQISELCLIGLQAYFEAFCKDQFSALINIHPGLIHNLKHGNHNAVVDTTNLLLANGTTHNLGYILAEKYRFGSAQKINMCYQELLNITPFREDEVKQYAKMRSDRNLLVHHGGTYTHKYLGQHETPEMPENYHPNMDGLEITSDRVRAEGEFLASIVRKTVRASHDALTRFLMERGHTISGDIKSALFMMRWWGDGEA